VRRDGDQKGDHAHLRVLPLALVLRHRRVFPVARVVEVDVVGGGLEAAPQQRLRVVAVDAIVALGSILRISFGRNL
jgi:hypothetical protein